MNRRTKNRLHGFSLIELLVVITILGVLITLLMPSIKRASELAKRQICQSQFKHIMVATTAYMTDSLETLPWLNSGSYASVGIGGPSSISPGSTQAQITAALRVDPLSRFTMDYLSAAWSYSSTEDRWKLPPVLICPGMPSNDKFVHSWMPGHANGNYRIGERSWGGAVVGFAAFTGLDHVTYSKGGYITGGNGCTQTKYRMSADGIPMRRIKLTDLRVPEEDVLLVDLVQQRGNATTYAVGSIWTNPHGSRAKPEGVNQATFDASVRWYDFRQLNYSYVPAYPWDRQILLPFFKGPRNKLQTGGYPYSMSGWVAVNPPWWGISQTPHAATYVPGN